MAKTIRFPIRDRLHRRVQFGDARRQSPAPKRTPVSGPTPQRRGPDNSLPARRNTGVAPAYRSPGRPAPRQAAIQNRIQQSPSGRYTRPSSPPSGGPGPVAPVKAAPDIGAFLKGDTGYQQQLRGFAQTLADFMGDVTRRRGTLNTEYGVSEKALGQQKTQDLESLESDYGARGMLRSGLYGSAVGDYNKEWLERFSELGRRKNEGLGVLKQEEGQYRSQQKLREQAAREEAVRRRAEQYGV